jgi:asparagine synthase (glutamine-hydrolysing)
MRRIIAGILKKVKPGIASEKIARTLSQESFDLENVYQFDRQVLLDDQVEKLLNTKDLPVKSVFKIVKDNVGYESDGYVLSPLSRVSWAEMNTYMQNVLLRDADQMSMAHSLEVRVPFLDHHLIEFVMGLNDEMKYPTSPKELLVDSFSELLPREIVDRKKMGFVFPWEKWLKNELKPFAQNGLSKLKERKEFNSAEIDKIWSAFLNGDPKVSWSRIWPMVVLGNWLEKNGIE